MATLEERRACGVVLSFKNITLLMGSRIFQTSRHRQISARESRKAVQIGRVARALLAAYQAILTITDT